MEPEPKPEDVQFVIGPYQVLKKIGAGGIGEVFLVYDPINHRKIALKRLRSDIEDKEQKREQFLNEAHITSQLSHPAIITIYAITEEKDLIYYTMPFIEGEPLQEILSKARQREMDGQPPEVEDTVPSMIHKFLKICQAVAYTHSKGIIHRDLKPSNVISGPYGEVRILDWGMASLAEKNIQISQTPPEQITVSGTISYLAPELMIGNKPSFQAEIYSLGLILYEMLTLRIPFHRENIKDYFQNRQKEAILDPAKVAPYRNIPPILARMALKCLAYSPEERYQTVEEIIRELEGYLQITDDWIKISDRHIQDKRWEIRENLSIAGIPSGSLLISKSSFAGNIKLVAAIQAGENSQGIGILFGLPSIEEQESKPDSFQNCDWLWLSTNIQKYPTEFGRLPKLVLKKPEVFLQKDTSYQLRIEKTKNLLNVYLNDTLQFSHAHDLPQSGTHVGIFAPDDDFIIKDVQIFIDSKSLQENPLAVPNAFLAEKNYSRALSNYRDISHSQPNTAEGRDAIFQAGITLLEEAKSSTDKAQSLFKSKKALEEFSKLNETPGAPLAYLGHALVYRWLKDADKEILSYEKAFRSYPHPSLLPVLHQHLLDRVNECHSDDRKTYYRFGLLMIQYLPSDAYFSAIQPLYDTLKNQLKPLYFIDWNELSKWPTAVQYNALAVHLAFLLAKPEVIDEIFMSALKLFPSPLPLLEQALLALIELGAWELARQKIDFIFQQFLDVQAIAHLEWIRESISIHQKNSIEITFLPELPKKLFIEHLRPIYHILNESLRRQKTDVVIETINILFDKHLLSSYHMSKLACYALWAHLLDVNKVASEKIINWFKTVDAKEDPYQFLYDCWSQFAENKNFELPIISPDAFLWEKRQIYLKYILFYHLMKDIEKEKKYRVLEEKTWLKNGSS